MPIRCAVTGCPSAKDKNKKHFFKFPQVESIAVQWIKATGRTNWIPTVNSAICEAHFRKDDFSNTKIKKRLKTDVVPTQNVFTSVINTQKPNNQSIYIKYIVNKNYVQNIEEINIRRKETEDILRKETKAENTIEVEIEETSTKRKDIEANIQRKEAEAVNIKKNEIKEISIRKEETNIKRKDTKKVRRKEIKEESIRREEKSQENKRNISTALEEAKLKIQKLEEENTRLEDLILSVQKKHKNDLKLQASALNVVIHQNQKEFKQKLATRSKQLILLRKKLKRKDYKINNLLMTAKNK